MVRALDPSGDARLIVKVALSVVLAQTSSLFAVSHPGHTAKYAPAVVNVTTGAVVGAQFEIVQEAISKVPWLSVIQKSCPFITQEVVPFVGTSVGVPGVLASVCQMLLGSF